VRVDAYGMNEQDRINEDDQFIELHDKQTLAINWTRSGIQFYNEDQEKNIELHESCRVPEDKEEEATGVTLEKCLEMFTATEKLGPDDPWYCSKCSEFQQATKKFDLWRMPPILVIHLKRFSYKNRYWREKLESYVDYPIHDLDFSKYAYGPQTVPPIYDLYAVSNHYGSLGGGHYTAYAKNKTDEKWYKYDDSSVTKISEQSVRTSSAYVLFYRRKDTIPQPAAPIIAEPSTNGSTEEDEATQPMDT